MNPIISELLARIQHIESDLGNGITHKLLKQAGLK
jgi:hypothetical protein